MLLHAKYTIFIKGVYCDQHYAKYTIFIKGVYVSRASPNFVAARRHYLQLQTG